MRARGDGEWVIDPGAQRGPGFERGLASRARYDAVELSFEACLEPGALLLAKVHQAGRLDQTTNSYHLLADERRAYLARHRHVFRPLEPPRSAWIRWRLACAEGVLTLWRNDRLTHRVRDRELQGGYAFLGAQGGAVRVRGLRLARIDRRSASALAGADEAETLQPVQTPAPRLSIVTTVYDRTECLRHCIASVRRLAFQDYEHLIVADNPPPEVLERIQDIVASTGDPRLGLWNMRRRHNNWGIAPAAAGLRRTRGEFVSFLSDDNGYLPDHVEPLIRTLDRDPALGFVYSSCQYDGRLVLAHPVPRPGRIDLGQPMFRRELFELHLADDLPFDMMAWDWHLVDTLMRRGVRWRHVNRPSFIFRLAKYPQLMAG
ncbi:MAG: glycosyltransferase family 2 protein [Gammaproteobacteria bacterium]